MIIVSQEKDAVLNFDNVIGIRTAIDIESNKENRIAIDTIEGERYYIARYSTEERAKEILQEIVRKYKLGTNKIKIKTSRGADIVERNIIYEMPKE